MHHTLKLQPTYYDYILYGTKRIEIRLYDDKRKQLNIGDTITFLKEPELSESFNARVIDLLKYPSFDELFKDYDIAMLASPTSSKQQLKNDLEKFYTKEKQKQYGVLGIVIELI